MDDNRPHPNPLTFWEQIIEGLWLRMDNDLDSLPLIAQSLQSIDATLKILATPSEPDILRLSFGKPTPKKEKLEMASSNVFDSPNVDMVPYVASAINADGSALRPAQTVAWSSDSANAIVVPNSNDASGLTGNIVAAAGFSGPVSGSAVLSDSANPSFSLSATWSGQFDAAAASEPIALSLSFGPPVPNAQAKK